MPFTEDDKARIIFYKAYKIQPNEASTDVEDLVQVQMAQTEKNTPYLVAKIQADLDTLDTLDTLLTTEQGNVNATLVQADSLKWSEDKTGGIANRFNAIRQRIADTLARSLENQSMRGMGSLLRG